jgi:hypothetical protein
MCCKHKNLEREVSKKEKTSNRTHPRALKSKTSAQGPRECKNNINLRATNTDKALSAWAPNTFLKNKAATVTPEDWIASLVAALNG